MAMSTLMLALAPYVGRICGAIALEDADDAMQETMIAVLRSLRGLRHDDALRSWVRRIAVRESVRVVRRRPSTVALDAAPELASPVPELAESADVAGTLAALAPAHRAVLVLRDVDGLSEAEVAEILGVATGTVKSRVHRAREAFRARWTR